MPRLSKMKPSKQRLTPAARTIVSHIINGVALGDYDRLSSVKELAASLGRTERGLHTMLRKLKDQGYLSIKPNAILPTVKALRTQDPNLSEKEAAKLLARTKRRL